MGGVAKAAAHLNITPSAISHQIRLLEGHLGQALLQKSGRAVVPTANGLQLALRLADLFDRLETAVADTKAAGRQKRLRVKVIPSFAIRWLVPRLAGFYALHNDIEIEIASVVRPEELNLENADLIVRHGRGTWPDVCSDLLIADALLPVCNAKLADSIHSAHSLLEFQLLHSMIRPEGWSVWFESQGLNQAQSRNNLFLANTALCLQAAMDGLGIAMTQRSYVEDDLQSGRLRVAWPHEATTDSGYYLVCDPQRVDMPPVSYFRNWLLSLKN
jgi:DNA-binding transcriptional LysR family regulator